MRSLFLHCFLLAAASCFFEIGGAEITNNEEVKSTLRLFVDESPKHLVTKRLGINLGTWTTWGAEQLCRNVLKNPGFEKMVDRRIVLVEALGKDGFYDGKNLGSADGSWNGAIYDVRTGPYAGLQGRIKASFREGSNGLPFYETEDALPYLEKHEVIVLSKQRRPAHEVGCWWVYEEGKEGVSLDPEEARPGSTGTESAVLSLQENRFVQLQFYLDAIPERAGKLLIVNGSWHFSLWAKASTSDNRLAISFERMGDKTPFFEKEITLDQTWREYTIEFSSKDNGNPGLLKLGIAAIGPVGSKIWLDDSVLASKEKNASVFRDDVVHLLRKLRPEYIRDWQGQLGDTASNRLSSADGRGCYRRRLSGVAPEWEYGYSIPDLIELCRLVKSKPWIIIPPVFSDEECIKLADYLRTHAHKKLFSEVFIEFGNENWNRIFRPLAIPYPKKCAEAADRAFTIIQERCGEDVNLKTVLQGQYASVKAALDFSGQSTQSSHFALSPYVCYTLDADDSDQERMRHALSDPIAPLERFAEGVGKQGKRLCFNEYNMHTTAGDAFETERNQIAAGVVSGSALARRTLQGLHVNASPMIVYALGGFDTKVSKQKEYVNLWGVARDLSPTNRLRPTGLVMELLNSVLNGSFHEIRGKEQMPLSMAALRTEKTWSALFVNEHSEPLTVELAFPDDKRKIPDTLFFLMADSLLATNEESEAVTIASSQLKSVSRSVNFTLPPFAFACLKVKEQEEK